MRIMICMHAYAIYACLSFDFFFLDVQFVFGSRFFFGVQNVGRPNLFFWTPNFFGRPKKMTSTIFAGRPFLDVHFFCWSSKLFFGVRFWERPTFFWDVQINFWDVRKKVWTSKKFGCPFFGRPIFLGWGRPKLFGASEKKNWTSKT